MFSPYSSPERVKRQPIIKPIREIDLQEVVTAMDLLPALWEISRIGFVTRTHLVELYIGVPKDPASLVRKELTFASTATPGIHESSDISYAAAVLNLNQETKSITLVLPPKHGERDSQGYRLSSAGVEIIQVDEHSAPEFIQAKKLAESKLRRVALLSSRAKEMGLL
jgi:hypothetical protein